MKIVVYTTRFCGYCSASVRLLRDLGYEFQQIPVDQDPGLRRKLAAENQGYRRVPMIFIDDRFIGGYNELKELHHKGQI